ncbi:hypothetical protein [Brucella endophytica]|nr:hypothetical protein [Brucella endophytica]
MIDLIHGALSVVSIGLFIATIAVWIGVPRSDSPPFPDNDFQQHE